MPIKILDPSVASKIAAGEVIENPASVVKELIENSIDANSTSIIINIEKSGKELISITDDGQGMSLDDLKICLYRYSTSKISDVSDLQKILSYGFRGEALYSIFSVSKISISTFDGKSDHGYKLEAEGGDFSTIKISPAPSLKGTTIEVRNLFFNLPARLKFLKSERSLKSSIIKVFENFALIHPEIKFKLKMDGEYIYQIEKSNSIEKRIEEICQIKKNEFLYTNKKFNNLEVEIFFSKPEKLFASKTYNYVYVNKRLVDSKTVSNAVYKAFENIRGSKYPFFLVSIKADPSTIDVNIHPQKREIKFFDEPFVYNTILIAIKDALEKNNSATINKIINIEKTPTYIEEKNSLKTDVFTEQSFIDTMYSFDKENKQIQQTNIRFIGQAFSKILIFETENSIVLLDQHAASERITFENYIKEFNEKKITKQNLLIPVEINLSSSAIEKIISMKEWLNEAGFEINQSSPISIKVYSYPSVFNLSDSDIKDLITYLIDIISKPNLIPPEIKRDAIATKACKASIKFNEFISKEKAISIFENLKKTKDPFRCPHGRPTLVEITKDDLASKFQRSIQEL